MTNPPSNLAKWLEARYDLLERLRYKNLLTRFEEVQWLWLMEWYYRHTCRQERATIIKAWKKSLKEQTNA